MEEAFEEGQGPHRAVEPVMKMTITQKGAPVVFLSLQDNAGIISSNSHGCVSRFTVRDHPRLSFNVT
jgi:hypothetical protein